jgi:hypothetical protein
MRFLAEDMGTPEAATLAVIRKPLVSQARR